MLELLNYNIQLNYKPIIGVKLILSGNNGGSWINVNENDEPKSFDFKSLPNFNWSDDVIDNQQMVRIPKFYIKNTDHKSIYISEEKFEGSHCHPAFMKNGIEQDCFWIGKYLAGLQNNKLTSLKGVLAGNLNRQQIRTYAKNRNTNGLTGFGSISFYQLCAIRFLFLIEFKTGRSLNISSIYPNYKNIIDFFLPASGWQICDGIYTTESGRYFVFNNNGVDTFIDTGFSATVTTQKITNGIVKMKSGKINNFDFGDVFIAESLSDDKNSTTYPDRYSVMGRSQAVLNFGNISNGIFSALLEGDLNYSRDDLYGRLSKI
jgi:hypothetical protein